MADRGRFRVLDACRGLCALGVVLFHLNANTHWYWLPAVRNAYVAVDFFFVLSGFVIASAYRDKLSTLPEALRFGIRRFGRLYPLHLAVLSVYVAIELWRLLVVRSDDAFTDQSSVGALIQHIFLVQGFTAAHESWNYPAWSISIELWVNVAFAVVGVAVGRWLRPSLVLLLVSLATLIVTFDRLPITLSLPQIEALDDALRSGFEFVAGILAFDLYRWAQRWNWRPAGAVEFATVPLVVWAFGYADTVPPLGLAAIFLVVVLVYSFESGPISSCLHGAWFQEVGASSYSIYLTHSLYLLAFEGATCAVAQRLGQPAGIPIDGDILLSLGGRWWMDAAGLVTVLCVLIGSNFTYRRVEDPARRFFNRVSVEVLPSTASRPGAVFVEKPGLTTPTPSVALLEQSASLRTSPATPTASERQLAP